MAESEVAICKRALRRIGQNAEMGSLQDQTQEALDCALFYPEVRDALLERFPWPFAKATATLQRIANFTPLQYAYGYGLPADCLKVRELWSGDRRPNREALLAYGFETRGDAKVLTTDETEPKLIYTARITDPRRFSAHFANALSWGLAAELAITLAIRPEDLGARAREEYERAIHLAAVLELGEEQIDEMQPPPALVSGGY